MPTNNVTLINTKDLKRYERNRRREWKRITSEKGLPPSTISSLHSPLSLCSISFTSFLNRLEKIILLVKTKNPTADTSLIEKAFYLAWEGHKEVFRQDGNPFLDHPLWVAEKLAEFGFGPEEIAAGLGHDLIEDGKIADQRITETLLASQLNKRVALIVQGVTELGKEPEYDGKISAAGIYKKWLEYGRKDLATIIIKLFDRWHNVKTLAYKEKEKQQRKAEETLKIYARIADILGIGFLKRELEDLSFEFADTENYRLSLEKRNEMQGQSHPLIEGIKNGLEAKFAQENLSVEVHAEIIGIYEFYQKVIEKQSAKEEISLSDLWHLKIVVSSVKDCYEALRIVNSLYFPLSGMFKDFISEPRLNGHQFLENWVRVPGFGPLSLQIQSKAMQKSNEMGILTRTGEEKWYQKSFPWLNAMLEQLKEEGLTEEEAKEIVSALSSPIKVFTPEGEEIILPFGASVLDFARKIHEDVFCHAVGAIINDRPVELFQKPNEGDRVRILLDLEAQPASLDWMDYLKTHEARKSLRAHLRKVGEKNKDVLIEKVQAALDQASQKYYLSGEQLIGSFLFKTYMKRLSSIDDLDTFLFKIGIGEKKIKEVTTGVLKMYQEELKKLVEKKEETEIFYLSVKTKDRIGLSDDLVHPLSRKLGFNIAEIFPIYLGKKEGEVEVIMVVGVGIFKKTAKTRLVREIQYQQVLNVAKRVGEVVVLKPEDVKEYFRLKLETQEEPSKTSSVEIFLRKIFKPFF